MSKERIDIEIHLSFREDFAQLRKLLYKIEEMRELVPEWNDTEAEQIHTDILNLAREIIDATGSQKNRSTKDSKPGSR